MGEDGLREINRAIPSIVTMLISSTLRSSELPSYAVLFQAREIIRD